MIQTCEKCGNILTSMSVKTLLMGKLFGLYPNPSNFISRFLLLFIISWQTRQPYVVKFNIFSISFNHAFDFENRKPALVCPDFYFGPAPYIAQGDNLVLWRLKTHSSGRHLVGQDSKGLSFFTVKFSRHFVTIENR
jgi:hypothetical protein